MDPRVDDLQNLGMMLEKKLGRLEMSSVDMLNKFADLGDKVGVVEEALLDEHAARETNDKKILYLGGKVDKIERNLMNIEEEKSLEILELKKMIRKIEEGQVEAQKNLLDLVESCQSMEDKLKYVENVN
jgi:hypothetical protein